jgi:hypothetical protein
MFVEATNNNSSAILSTTAPNWLRGFVDIYQQLSTDNLNLLEQVYHQDVTFIDPMHEIQGFNELSEYFKALYTNLSACEFVIEQVIEQPFQAAIYWQMTYCHKKLNGGKPIQVQGHSHIKGHDGKVIYHRDYIDLGAMLYEHLPVLGKVTQWIKKRAGQ